MRGDGVHPNTYDDGVNATAAAVTAAAAAVVVPTVIAMWSDCWTANPY